MKSVFSFIRSNSLITMVVAVVAGVLFVTMAVNASTTISTSITTGGSVFASSTAAITGATSIYGNLTVNGNATTTALTGAIATQGNLTVLGTASTSALKVGDEPNVSTINGLVFGYCVTGSITIPATNASSTQTYTNCTPSGGTGVINSGDRVFVQATSSLPYYVVIQSASSTASGGLINIGLTNFSASTSPAAAIYSFNFWAVR